MKKRPIGISAIISAALTLTACGGNSSASQAPPKPTVSAAAACKDFQTWFLSVSQAGDPQSVATMKNIAKLRSAVSESPSGQLYQDMSTLESDVETASGASSDLASGEDLMTLDAVQTVQNDCSSINPNG